MAPSPPSPEPAPPASSPARRVLGLWQPGALSPRPGLAACSCLTSASRWAASARRTSSAGDAVGV
eukprot:6339506-Pyramimonas_sp.AAC.1